MPPRPTRLAALLLGLAGCSVSPLALMDAAPEAAAAEAGATDKVDLRPGQVLPVFPDAMATTGDVGPDRPADAPPPADLAPDRAPDLAPDRAPDLAADVGSGAGGTGGGDGPAATGGTGGTGGSDGPVATGGTGGDAGADASGGGHCGPTLGATRGSDPCIGPIRQLSMDHTSGACAVLESGDLHCWGYGCSGGLGEGTRIQHRLSPGPAILTGVRQMDRMFHLCAVTSSGGLRCWGDNSGGQLGDGTSGPQPRLAPPATDQMTGVRQVATGAEHTCVLLESGGVRCWGSNRFGQLGDGTVGIRTSPPTTDLLTDVRAISAALYVTCALRNDGGVRCWGSNSEGALGNGGMSSSGRPPATDVLTGVRTLETSGRQTCAIMQSGGLRCWGLTPGKGVTTAPPTTDLLTGVASIAVGNLHSCAVLEGGALRCWGSNDSGQLGLGTTGFPQSTPSGSMTGVLDVSVGLSTTCARFANGVKCWGHNGGSFGDGTLQNSLQPRPLLGTCP